MGLKRVEQDWATKLNWTSHFGINQGFLCSLISKSEFPLKADPNAKTQAQIIYLGDGPGKHGLGDRQKEMGQEEDVIADASLRNLLLRTSGGQSFWTLSRELYRYSQILSPWRTECWGCICAWTEQPFFISEKVRKYKGGEREFNPQQAANHVLTNCPLQPLLTSRIGLSDLVQGHIL